MIKELVHDPDILAIKSEKASAEDLSVAQDLLDTLMAHKGECVGMAANMIGVHKRIIAVEHEDSYLVMLNPKILEKSGPYNTEEGCLSLLGGPRPCKRFQSIKVRWQTPEMAPKIRTFTGWTAQIIQHEIDPCNGVLI